MPENISVGHRLLEMNLAGSASVLFGETQRRPFEKVSLSESIIKPKVI
jgi:hypothetical protein